MDAIDSLLGGPHARGVELKRSTLSPPWSLRIDDPVPLSLLAVARGHARLQPGSTDVLTQAVRLNPGDVAIMRGQAAHTIANDHTTTPHGIMWSNHRFSAVRGEDLSTSMDPAVRTGAHSQDGRAVLLTRTYPDIGECGRMLLDPLPTLFVLRETDWDNRLIPILREEIDAYQPGQQAVLSRTTDLILIVALRTWLHGIDSVAPAWYRAHDDPVIGGALRMIQNNPAHQWTVAALATEIGVSRAWFARRFNDVVGQPPITFLTNWRMSLAADLLQHPGATLAAVARQVGYGSAFALSNAFKRVRGVSPRQHSSRASASVTVGQTTQRSPGLSAETCDSTARSDLE